MVQAVIEENRMHGTEIPYDDGPGQDHLARKCMHHLRSIANHRHFEVSGEGRTLYIVLVIGTLGILHIRTPRPHLFQILIAILFPIHTLVVLAFLGW